MCSKLTDMLKCWYFTAVVVVVVAEIVVNCFLPLSRSHLALCRRRKSAKKDAQLKLAQLFAFVCTNKGAWHGRCTGSAVVVVVVVCVLSFVTLYCRGRGV